MASKAGVGYSNNTDSKTAGQEAAAKAMKEAGLKSANVAMIFTTSKHDPEQIRVGVRAAVGPDVQLIGGYAVGIITRNELSYAGYEVGVALIQSDSIKFKMIKEHGLGTGHELEVGKKLGAQLKSLNLAKSDGGIVLMYDSVRGDAKSPLNMATPLLEGMTSALGSEWPEIAGVGLLGDMQFMPTKQWFGNEVINQSAMVLGMTGCHLDTMIIHGMKPASDYHKITKVDNNVVLEISGIRAVDKIAELLGPNSGVTPEQYGIFVTLGVNKGNKFEDFQPENYANRLVMTVDKERGGLVMFENDLKVGDEVQLMSRNPDFDYMADDANALMGRLKGKKPVLAIYIDCAGRTAAFSGMGKEEAAEIQKSIGPKVPLLGMYSGVEIAKVNKRVQALDWTGVLAILSEN